MPLKKKTTGMMDKTVFATLLKTIEYNPWKAPALDGYAYDGVAWEIESYRDDGSVKNTSEKLDYI